MVPRIEVSSGPETGMCGIQARLASPCRSALGPPVEVYEALPHCIRTRASAKTPAIPPRATPCLFGPSKYRFPSSGLFDGSLRDCLISIPNSPWQKSVRCGTGRLEPVSGNGRRHNREPCESRVFSPKSPATALVGAKMAAIGRSQAKNKKPETVRTALLPASRRALPRTDRCKSRVTRIQARMYLQSASRKNARTCSGDSFNEWKAVLRLARICAFVLLTC